MPPIHDLEVWQSKLAALPLASYGAGETVLTEGTKTGRLLILKSGAVSIVKSGTEIDQVAEPGAVFGELSALLDQPHTADVRTLKIVGVSCRRRRHIAARPGGAALRDDGPGAARRGGQPGAP